MTYSQPRALVSGTVSGLGGRPFPLHGFEEYPPGTFAHQLIFFKFRLHLTPFCDGQAETENFCSDWATPFHGRGISDA